MDLFGSYVHFGQFCFISYLFCPCLFHPKFISSGDHFVRGFFLSEVHFVLQSFCPIFLFHLDVRFVQKYYVNVCFVLFLHYQRKELGKALRSKAGDWSRFSWFVHARILISFSMNVSKQTNKYRNYRATNKIFSLVCLLPFVPKLKINIVCQVFILCRFVLYNFVSWWHEKFWWSW